MVFPLYLLMFTIQRTSVSEVVVEWNDGADDFFPNPLDWIYSDEDEDPTLALLNAVEEEFHW